MPLDTRFTVGRYDTKIIAKRFFDRTIKLRISAERRFIKKMKARHPGSLVLDVGCGVGKDLARFLRAGLNAVGVDGARELLKLAQQRLQISPAKLFEADLRSLPFSPGTFGGLWMRAVLGHFPYPDNLIVLKEMARVANSDALLFARIREGDREGMEEKDGTTRYYKYYRSDEVRTLLQQAGFAIDCLRYSKGEIDKSSSWIHIWAHLR
ncbi:MAG: class I SAM-dependent methyltransferase [Candidatus Margulisiibacteriota bacterium]